MGASASKPTETKVFAPSNNIQYGQSLIGELESSVESDYIRSQYTEIGLQKKVSEKLDTLAKKSNEFFDTTLKKSLLTKDTEEDKDLSSVQLNDKISQLSKVLESKNDKFLQLNDDVLKSKKEIVSCLIKNNKRPLNCWDEVKNFEKLVNEL
jgi:altered-inheritance-of-mitochondria protein 13